MKYLLRTKLDLLVKTMNIPRPGNKNNKQCGVIKRYSNLKNPNDQIQLGHVEQLKATFRIKPALSYPKKPQRKRLSKTKANSAVFTGSSIVNQTNKMSSRKIKELQPQKNKIDHFFQVSTILKCPMLLPDYRPRVGVVRCCFNKGSPPINHFVQGYVQLYSPIVFIIYTCKAYPLPHCRELIHCPRRLLDPPSPPQLGLN